jgi:hypothetical protein
MAEKKVAKAHAHVRAITLLLKEEHASIAALEVEAVAATLQLASTTASSSAPPPPRSRGNAAVVTMLHAQACRVQNLHSLESTVLDAPSTCYAHWHDQVLLTLKHYDLTDHVLSNTPLINDSAWERMESVVISWIFSTIINEL